MTNVLLALQTPPEGWLFQEGVNSPHSLAPSHESSCKCMTPSRSVLSKASAAHLTLATSSFPVILAIPLSLPPPFLSQSAQIPVSCSTNEGTDIPLQLLLKNGIYFHFLLKIRPFLVTSPLNVFQGSQCSLCTQPPRFTGDFPSRLTSRTAYQQSELVS